jgi:hypothetical protein
MAKRHDDALYINERAVNLVAISYTLHETMQAMLRELGSVDRTRKDPAVRIILHQLAFLCEMTGGYDLDEYSKYVAECYANASDYTLRMLKRNRDGSAI